MERTKECYKNFKVERDPFCLEPDQAEGVEERWWNLAEILVNEKSSKSDTIIGKFKTVIAEDGDLNNHEDARLSSDGFLARFLRASCWDVENALKILKLYSNLGAEYRCYVSRAIPSKLDSVWNAKINTMTEKRDKFGRRIYLFRLGKWDPDRVKLEDFYASAYVLLELAAREVRTQVAGLTVINDVTDLGWRHLRCLGLEQMKAIVAFMNGAFPIWVRRIHIVNQPRIFGILFNMVKPLLDERVRDNIVIHGNNLQSLHEEVSPEMLPKDLGGKGELDNSAAVAAAKSLDNYFKDHVEKSLARIDQNNNSK